jgi:predicted RNA-binding Zn ribbon-like protein
MAAILTIVMHLDGENLVAGPQPGGRPPAPGELALLQSFVNSNYDLEFEHGAELLASPADLRAWLARRGLVGSRARVGAGDLSHALAVREGLRALLVANNGEPLDEPAVDALNAVAASFPVTVRLSADGPRFEPQRRDVDSALGLILSIAATAMHDGTWRRLKACNECRWAFYDHSRNGAGNWCSMAVCGGRVKQRAYYRRRR